MDKDNHKENQGLNVKVSISGGGSHHVNVRQNARQNNYRMEEEKKEETIESPGKLVGESPNIPLTVYKNKAGDGKIEEDGNSMEKVVFKIITEHELDMALIKEKDEDDVDEDDENVKKETWKARFSDQEGGNLKIEIKLTLKSVSVVSIVETRLADRQAVKDLAEANQKLSLSKYPLEELAPKVRKALKLVAKTCGKPEKFGKKRHFAKKYIKKIGVVGVVAKFLEVFEGENDMFLHKNKILKIYESSKKHPTVLAHGDPTKIEYIAQIFKGFLLDQNYPVV